MTDERMAPVELIENSANACAGCCSRNGPPPKPSDLDGGALLLAEVIPAGQATLSAALTVDLQTLM